MARPVEVKQTVSNTGSNLGTTTTGEVRKGDEGREREGEREREREREGSWIWNGAK